MRRTLVIAGIICSVTILFVVAVLLQMRANTPERLLAALARADGEQEDIIMRLNLARGDTVPAMLAAMQQADARPAFRGVVLELLFKKYKRDADSRIEPVLQASLHDPAVEVRRQAAYGYGVYMSRKDQRVLVPLISDPDAKVRQQVYLLLTERGRRGDSLWGELSEAERAEAVAKAKAQMRAETDPALKFLAAGVVGRHIADLCEKAREAEGRGDLGQAETLLREGLTLNPDCRRAQISLARFYIRTGQRDKGLAVADRYHALIRVPRLTAAPTVDGDPTEPAWKGAVQFDTFFHGTSRWVAKPTDGKNRALVGYFDNKVYVAVFGFEKDLDKLVVKHKNRDSSVWRDDCVELFFDPLNTETDVWQFVINPVGTLFDSWKKQTKHNCESECAAQIFKDRGYWGCEFAVSAAALQAKPLDSGAIWGMNIMRTRIGPASEQGAIWPTYGWSLNYRVHPIAVFETP